jgi:histidine kinase
MKWTWDCTEIRESYTATSNVADILVDRMKKSGDALAILPIAAALGNEFSPEVFQMIVDHIKIAMLEKSGNALFQPLRDMEHVIHSLDRCVEEGLLETTPNGTFKFCHDKILETSMTFLDDDVKICIGNSFLDRFDKGEEQFGDAFYPLLSLIKLRLNELVADESKKFRVVELFTLAGEKALQYAAFEAASDFFNTAMRFLPTDHWTTHRNISLRIFVMAGASAFNAGAGHQDRVKEYTDVVLAQSDIPLLDKVDLCYTMMDVFDAAFTSEANLANFNFGFSLLKDFGCRFPQGAAGILTKTLTGLLNAKLSLKKKLSPKVLESMPISTDPQTVSIMKILDKFSIACFHNNSDLLPLVMLRQAHYTDRFGLTPYAALSYPLLGMLFCTMDDFES